MDQQPIGIGTIGSADCLKCADFFPLGIFEIFWGCYTPNPTDHTTAQLFNGDCSPAMCEAGGSMTEVDRATWVVRGTVRLLDHRTRLPMFGDA